MDASRRLYPPVLQHDAYDGPSLPQAVDVYEGLLTNGPSEFDYSAQNGPVLDREVRVRCQYYYAMLQCLRRNLEQDPVPYHEGGLKGLKALLLLTIEYLWGTYARQMHGDSRTWRTIVQEMKAYAPMFEMDRTTDVSTITSWVFNARRALVLFEHEVHDWERRREAVGMSLHPRLGMTSALGQLGPDVLSKVI